jgi:hypothetical protein
MLSDEVEIIGAESSDHSNKKTEKPTTTPREPSGYIDSVDLLFDQAWKDEA